MAKAKRTDYLIIEIENEFGGVIESQSVEANLLYMILEKMEEIRINQIDIETELQNLKKE